MLTRKQYDLLMYIHERIRKDGVSPSFDEMKEALALKSKSGIHRLITALEERGYLRRLPHRARALEVVRLPENIAPQAPPARAGAPRLSVVPTADVPTAASRDRADDRALAAPSAEPHGAARLVELVGRIAAGAPIEALSHAHTHVEAPAMMLRSQGEHYALEVKGDSMVDAGIHDGDVVVIERRDTAQNGEIIVALIDGEEATLKRLRRKGGAIALEAANPAYETRVYGADRVRIQGRLAGLIRTY